MIRNKKPLGFDLLGDAQYLPTATGVGGEGEGGGGMGVRGWACGGLG